MKKILAVLLLLCGLFVFASCDSKDEAVKLDAPVITLSENVVSWTAVENAKSYNVFINDEEVSVTETSYKITKTEAGDYVIKVVAVAEDTEKYLNSDASNSVTYTVKSAENTENGDSTPTPTPVVLDETKVYVVGDSTVCSYEGQDLTYYYKRYGYATQFSNYLDSKATIVNLAISGRSSLSYIKESNYELLKTSIKEGDYLVIGFGHNDEKSDDPTRYSEPLGSVTTEGSFKYNLYNYYIKVANDAGATPILCTPICRANSSDNYTGNAAHVTNGADYSEVIKELGTETNTTVIDLTLKTKELYTEVGYNEAIKYHAWLNSKASSVDTTHINIYGAKMVAYMFATELAKTSNKLGKYVLNDITAPTEANDLKVNSTYVEPTYETPDLASYTPNAVFTTTSEGWYGTAFGDTGGSAISKGFFAKETSTGVFEVGQSGSSPAGKISSTVEGIAFAFRQVSKNKNFTLTANVEITKDANTNQAGFGLMLRDDVYITPETKDPSILSNYVTAGMYLSNNMGKNNIIYSRENAALKNSDNTITTAFTTGDTAVLTIERIGQVVNCTVVYKGTTYTETYTDFDFVALDNDYMYIGMYATRGVTAKFTDVEFTITGDAIAA